MNTSRPITPPRTAQPPKKRWRKKETQDRREGRKEGCVSGQTDAPEEGYGLNEWSSPSTHHPFHSFNISKEQKSDTHYTDLHRGAGHRRDGTLLRTTSCFIHTVNQSGTVLRRLCLILKCLGGKKKTGKIWMELKMRYECVSVPVLL